MTAKQTVFVVEDDPRMCAAIELLLRTSGYAVRSYPDAETLLGDETCVRSNCLLADIRLPGMDGLALHRRLVATGTTPATVMITGHGDIPMAVSALKEGVVDFIEKPFHPPALLESVKEALRRAMAVHDHEMKIADLKVRLETLTPREAEVLDLLVDGQPSKVIASQLGMSVRTAEHHRARIMEKLGAPSTMRLISMMSAK
ncbi:MAG TPA: response regulator [Roseiarcus sp.]|nr:response regulator [Roseiarcus sp.]